MSKTLQEYIDQYGEVSGTKRYNGVQETLRKRAETYKKHPYKRLTKEWFMWRYPDDGLQRFNNHVEKSRQSEENMIARWGEELGKQKWQELLVKKNTVAIVREQRGEEAVAEWYKKRAETMSKHTEEQKADRKRRAKEKMGKYLSENVRGKTRLELFISRYGEIDGLQKYHEAMKKTYSGPNRMSAPAKRIYDMLCSKLSPEYIDQIYCDVPGKKEFWLSEPGKIYGYDFTHRESKTILEYNGSFWHPDEPSSEIHPVTRRTLAEMYETDINKKKIAEANGFTVLIISDKMTSDEQEIVVDLFCKSITKGE